MVNQDWQALANEPISADYVCPACDMHVTCPDWNPYDGVWECPDCGSAELDMIIPIGPRDAEFTFNNLNPDI